MEEAGSTSLRAELQVLLEDPTNFYNVVMSNSGERGAGRRWRPLPNTTYWWAGLVSLVRANFSLSTSVFVDETLV